MELLQEAGLLAPGHKNREVQKQFRRGTECGALAS